MTFARGVTAVTVTYGAREQLALETARRALATGAREVLIVDNGCDAVSRQKLAAGIAGFDHVHLSEPAANRGSAVGFGSGISFALARGAEYIWLLDDDNWAHPDALDALLRSLPFLPEGSALCSLRTSDALQLQVAAGAPVETVYPEPGAFFGISATRRMRLAIERLIGKGHQDAMNPSSGRVSARVPFAPYGGFFASASTFVVLGLPDPSFFLYEDDTEYTERVLKQGGHITLMMDSRVDDADGKWSDGAESSGIARLINATDGRRLFYATRNRARVDAVRARRHGRVPILCMNMIVFMLGVAWRGVGLRRPARSIQIIRYLLTGVRQAYSRAD